MGKLIIAAYLRISDEDKDIEKRKKAESDSIGNQRNLISDFISRSPEFKDADVLEFCDDGFSGKNFERPAFQEMIKKVKRGEIQCIIVKDLSRLGRDYLTVGNYISRIFPFLGIRFIAVNDGFDSARQMDNDGLDASFKTLLHDFYSQDLSRKVRSAQNLRAGKGEFLSSFAPFGYVKNEKNGKKLVIDPAAAEIVRRIFYLAAENYSTAQIARILNGEKVPTPMQYKLAAGYSRKAWGCSHTDNFWTHNTVLKILRDERYIGNNIYGRKRRAGVGSLHARTVPRDEWVIVENTHEGIVTREEFDRVQEKIRKTVRQSGFGGKRKLFYRKVKCGVCGYAMTRMKGKQPYFSCQTRHVTDSYACPKERILEGDLEKMVLTDLNMRVSCMTDMSRIREEKRRMAWQAAVREEKSIAGLRRSLAETESQIRTMYEQFVLGELGKEEYLAGKEVLVRKKETVLFRIKEAENRQKSTYRDRRMEERETVCQIASLVLQEVTVYPERKLDIVWKWRDDLHFLY